MTTVARMLVEMAGDPSGLQRAFRQMVRDSQDTARDMRAAMNNRPLVDGAASATAGREAARSMVQSLKNTYNSEMATAREQMARGIINPRQFAQAGEAAAVNFNRAMLDGIQDLRNNKMLPTSVHNKLVRELKDAGMEAGKAAREAMQQQLASVASGLSTAGGALSGAGRGLTTSVTLPIVGLGVVSAKLAADAAESFNKFDVLFGAMAQNVGRELAVLHRSIPATTAQLKDMASNFNSLLVPMGMTQQQAAQMSVRLVKLGGDLTSLHNIPVEDVMVRLFSGLVGETEAVRRFGVDISEARLKVLAHSAGLGDNVQALTRAQKTQLIYNEILRATSIAHGDAAATAGSAANQMRFVERDFKEAATAIGQRLLPALVPLMQHLSAILERISKLSPAQLDSIIKWGLLAAAIGPVLMGLGSMLSTLSLVTIAVKMLTGAMGGAGAAGGTGLLGVLTGPVGLVVLFGLATAALLLWASHARNAKVDVDALAASFRGMTMAQLQARMAEEGGKLAQLRKEADDAKRNANGAGVGSKGDDASGASAAARRVIEQEALMKGLAKTMNDVAVQRDRDQQTEEANILRNKLAYDELMKGMTNSSLAAAAAAKQAKKDNAEWLQTMGGAVSTLGDMYTMAEKFHLSTGAIGNTAVEVFREIQDRIAAAGGVMDANTAKLYNMLEALLKIKAVASSPWAPGMPGIQVTGTGAGPMQQQAMAGALQALVARNAGGLGLGIGGMVPPPTVTGANMPGFTQAVPPEVSNSTLRFRIALDDAKGAAVKFGRGLLDTLGGALRDLLNPVRFFGEFLSEIASTIRPALEPLRPALTALAKIVSDTLAPVFATLAPVIEDLAPLIRAVMQVLAPILQALAPLIRAFIPLFEALFPVFKLVAIAATYVGQAFGIASSIVMRAVGNIIIGFGQIMYGLAKAIDSLPFVSAGHAMDVANEVIDMGRGMLTSSDEFKNMANDMAHAREEIKKVNLQTTDSVKQLGDAAAQASESLLSMPSIFRLHARLAEQYNPWTPSGTGTGTGTGPVDGGPLGWHPGGTGGTGTGTGSTGGGTSGVGGGDGAGGQIASAHFIVQGDLIVQTSGDGVETYENMEREARRRALATSGQAYRALTEG